MKILPIVTADMVRKTRARDEAEEFSLVLIEKLAIALKDEPSLGEASVLAVLHELVAVWQRNPDHRSLADFGRSVHEAPKSMRSKILNRGMAFLKRATVFLGSRDPRDLSCQKALSKLMMHLQARDFESVAKQLQEFEKSAPRQRAQRVLRLVESPVQSTVGKRNSDKD